MGEPGKLVSLLIACFRIGVVHDIVVIHSSEGIPYTAKLLLHELGLWVPHSSNVSLFTSGDDFF